MIWQRTLRILRPPRRLRTTREGKIVLGIALAVGFAAINTGNNLLFLGWGTVLSAIVLSGILSEAALRTFAVESFPPQSARVDQNVRLPLSLANLSKHQTTFGMRVVLRLLYQGKQPLDATAPFEFCLPPGAQVRRYAHFTPRQRGAYHTDYLQAHTTYPFGFFDKSRRFHAEQRSIFWVAPARIPVDDVVISLRSRLGETPAGRIGRGEDFFSLRPFRQGDDVRFVHWRRSARVGRRVIVKLKQLPPDG
ncbi:MAG: DUF58 domain-containing protein [Myxococcota bacterium]